MKEKLKEEKMKEINRVGVGGDKRNERNDGEREREKERERERERQREGGKIREIQKTEKPDCNKDE